jgi:Protein  of unknown function (DUF3018)
MPRLAPKDGHDKFSRYRASKRSQGLKLVRLWVPDPDAPGFRAEAERQAALLRGAPEEQEAMAFIETAAAELGIEPYDWGPDGPPPWPHDPKAASGTGGRP